MKKPETTKKQSTAQVVQLPAEITAEVERVVLWSSNNSVSFDLALAGGAIKLYSCRVGTSKDGKDFISYPSYKASSGKYYNHCIVFLSEERQAAVLKVVEDKLAAGEYKEQ